jgi:PKD repeat protein
MSITLRNKVANVGASVTPSIVLPAGILGGECIRVTIGWNNGGTGVTCSNPTGFTQIGTTTTIGGISCARFFKIAAGTVGAPSADAGATVSATLSTSKAWVTSSRVFSGSDPVNPIHAAAAATNSAVTTTHAAPSIAVTRAGCWVEEGVCERGSSASYTTPAGLTDTATAGPQAVTAPALIATADTGAVVSTGTRGGDIWTGTAATSAAVTWTTAIAPAGASAPTAAFTGGSTGGYTVTVDGTGSTAVSPATVTGYSWDWGDGSTDSSGVTASHDYSASGPGDYTITLTVTDSAAATDTEAAVVTVAAPSATVLPLSVLATGFTPTGGTELTVFTDTSEATFDTSPANPTAVSKTYYFPEIAAPLAGQGIFLEMLTDRLNSSSGSLTAKLYQDTAKTVLISTVSSVAIPDGTAAVIHPDSSVTAPLVINFPFSDVAVMTSYATPTVEITETAA